MKITEIPKSYTGAYTPLEYRIESSTPERVLEVSILNRKGDVLGVKHLVGESRYSVNIAPYVRRELEVEPTKRVDTGFYGAVERTAEVRIRVAELANSAKNILSPLTIFTCASQQIAEQKMLSTAPKRVEIADNECDEIAFIAPDRVAVALITLYGEQQTREIAIGESGDQSNLVGYRCGQGMTLFMLNIESILGDIELNQGECYRRLTLEILVKEDELDSRNGAANNEIDSNIMTTQMKSIARREYRVVPRDEEHTRLCWVNQMGAVDHYNFTAQRDLTLVVDRSRAYTQQGYKAVSATEQLLTTLRSQIEPEGGLRWLSGVVVATKVWRVESEQFVPIDVVTNSVGIRDSTPLSLTITVRDAK